MRIATKKLRYALEIADESGAAPCSAARPDAAQARPGHARPPARSAGAAAPRSAVAAAPHTHRPTPDAALAILSRSIEDECRHLHGRYVALVPALVNLVETARRDVVARLTVSSRKRAARTAKMKLPVRRRTATGQH